MKEGIHPNYEQTTIKCACGNVIETGSTKKDIRVEVCSKCHPFFTGKQKMVDTGGRVSPLQQEVRFGKLNDFVFGPVPSRHGFFPCFRRQKNRAGRGLAPPFGID